MKTYVITLAKTFPAGHPNAGHPTYFREKVEAALNGHEHASVKADRNGWMSVVHSAKIHTIRTDVTLWAKRMKDVEAGEACLSIREWSGRPYNSKQVEIARLKKGDCVGLQVLRTKSRMYDGELYASLIAHGSVDYTVEASTIAMNDGLSLDDWLAWFKGCKEDSLAIIHFTPFRY